MLGWGERHHNTDGTLETADEADSGDHQSQNEANQRRGRGG